MRQSRVPQDTSTAYVESIRTQVGTYVVYLRDTDVADLPKLNTQHLNSSSKTTYDLSLRGRPKAEG